MIDEQRLSEIEARATKHRATIDRSSLSYESADPAGIGEDLLDTQKELVAEVRRLRTENQRLRLTATLHELATEQNPG